MWLDFALVALGGALGSVARHGAGLAAQSWHHNFPLATFIINIVGSLAIGLVAGWLGDAPVDFGHQARMLLVVGLCGGFTTFSSFSLETFTLLRGGQALVALGYVLLSVVLCLSATLVGYSLTHR